MMTSMRMGSSNWETKTSRPGVHTYGESNVIVQEIKFSLGGTTGWHKHPGVVLLTLAADSGPVDWYDAHCGKVTYEAGDTWTESTRLHDVVNNSAMDAHFLVTYLSRQLSRRGATSARMSPHRNALRRSASTNRTQPRSERRGTTMHSGASCLDSVAIPMPVKKTFFRSSLVRKPPNGSPSRHFLQYLSRFSYQGAAMT